ISQVQPLADFGTWKCHINRRRGTDSISEWTRKTIVAPTGASERGTTFAAAAAAEKMSSKATTTSSRITDRNEYQNDHPKARLDYGIEGSGEEYQSKITQKISAFTRPDGNSAHSSRTVLINRYPPSTVINSSIQGYRQQSIDYELSMADEDVNDHFRYQSYSKRA
ncbi:hypothetical protein PENTCL1PPCAC_1317, partial [Pristionchus entomophagus]